MLVGAQAIADDEHYEHKDMMKDCMARMADKHDGASHHQMTEACHKEIKEAKERHEEKHDK